MDVIAFPAGGVDLAFATHLTASSRANVKSSRGNVSCNSAMRSTLLPARRKHGSSLKVDDITKANCKSASREDCMKLTRRDFTAGLTAAGITAPFIVGSARSQA